MMEETQISRSDGWMKNNLFPGAGKAEQVPAWTILGGLIALSCRNSHKLVCDLCPPHVSMQCGVGWGGGTAAFCCGVEKVSVADWRNCFMNTPVPFPVQRHFKKSFCQYRQECLCTEEALFTELSTDLGLRSLDLEHASLPQWGRFLRRF